MSDSQNQAIHTKEDFTTGTPVEMEHVSPFQAYLKSSVTFARPYVEGEDLTGVSISGPDRENGSPKIGDMIARNDANHADQWLIAEEYFRTNFLSVVIKQ